METIHLISGKNLLRAQVESNLQSLNEIKIGSKQSPPGTQPPEGLAAQAESRQIRLNQTRLRLIPDSSDRSQTEPGGSTRSPNSQESWGLAEPDSLGKSLQGAGEASC